MNSPNRAALTLVLGTGVFPAMAQPQRASDAASTKASESPASGPQHDAQPGGGVEWFAAGVAVGIVLTVAWFKIRGNDKGGGTAAIA